MAGENKFTAGARIPTRPLSMENVHLAENKELVVDYEKHEIYVKDSNGNLVNVTASVTTVIEEVKKQMEEDPTVVTDAIVELPNGDHITIQKSIFEIYEKFEELEKNFEELETNLGVETDEETGEVTLSAEAVKTDTDHQFVTAEEKSAWNAKTDIIQLITKISAGTSKWTGSEAPYKQIINIADIKETDYPVVDVVLSEDYETAMNELSNYAFIYKILTFNGYIEVYSIKPTEVELTIVMKIDR